MRRRDVSGEADVTDVPGRSRHGTPAPSVVADPASGDPSLESPRRILSGPIGEYFDHSYWRAEPVAAAAKAARDGNSQSGVTSAGGAGVAPQPGRP
jgi:hypothetical protein